MGLKAVKFGLELEEGTQCQPTCLKLFWCHLERWVERKQMVYRQSEYNEL